MFKVPGSMKTVYSAQQIKKAINLKQNWQTLLKSQQQAFIDFSKGLVQVPPPLQMHFEKARGDCHVKAGFKKDGDIFAVKIATGFYQNTLKNLPAGDGAILVFCQQTGLLKAILCDGGYLTTLRTAIAACIAAKTTPWKIQRIGIVGTGQLAAQLLELFHLCNPHAAFKLWGRSFEKAKNLASAYTNADVNESIEELVSNCDLIITTTANSSPIINLNYVHQKTHIIALGSDELGKQECDPKLFQHADVVIVDSKKQAQFFGDTFYALQSGLISYDKLQELGTIIETGISRDAKVIISDFTGIAAQDIAIAESTLKLLKKEQ